MNDFLEFVKNKIKNNIKVEKIKIINNSNLHKKHKSFDPEKYHLKLEIESVYLKSLNKIKGQREIMTILSQELKTKIHALEIEIK
jgi:stress-induced morphogen